MKTKRLFSLLLSFLFVLGYLAAPARAVEAANVEAQLVITRATGRFETSIPAKTIAHLADSFILDSGDVVSYECLLLGTL